jgi:succinate dehydrogenase / fumarate reductase cytochrome b subunit
MRWGGTAILLFVVFHVLNLTTRTITPGGDSDSPYVRMVNDFSPDVWWVPVIYLLALAALAMHLRHGVWSAAQTFGLANSSEARRWWNVLGYLTATVIAGGFAIIPLSVLFGLIST